VGANKGQIARAAEPVLEPGEVVELTTNAVIGSLHLGRQALIAGATALATGGLLTVTVSTTQSPIVLTTRRLLVLGLKNTLIDQADSKIKTAIPRSMLRAVPPKRVLLYRRLDLTDAEGNRVARLKMSFFDKEDAERIAQALGPAPPPPPPAPKEEKGGWPFAGPFAPLQAGQVEVIEPQGKHRWRLRVQDLGVLVVESGRLLACDPFVTLTDGGVVVAIPPGDHPVKVTIADVSDQQDGSHEREAYLSVVVRDGQAVRHAPMVPVDHSRPKPGEFHGVGVDSGTVGFVDEVAAKEYLPSGDIPESWLSRMDAGYADIALPGAKDGENVIMCHSGLGDGYYPVIGTYDGRGELLGVHIDLQVVGRFLE